MKKAIATPAGKPTEHVELTTKEINKRNTEIEANFSKEEEGAPYKRLEEIDAELTSKAPRMLEDLFKGLPLHESVVKLIEEKDTIRINLTSQA